jgi:hypothetical protein
VDADPAAARLDVALEGILLPRGQDVAGGVEEDDGAEASEVPLGECAGLLRRLDGEAVLLSELPHGGDAGLDRAVTEAGGLREHEDAGLLVLRRRGDGCGREEEHGHDEESEHSGRPGRGC